MIQHTQKQIIPHLILKIKNLFYFLKLNNIQNKIKKIHTKLKAIL